MLGMLELIKQASPCTASADASLQGTITVICGFAEGVNLLAGKGVTPAVRQDEPWEALAECGSARPENE